MKQHFRIRLIPLFILGIIFIIISACKRDKPIETEVMGFEFLNKIPGLWHGPVSTSTSAGNFTDWYIDFRPVSETQVSQFSLLDTNTVNKISFFIVKYHNELRVAQRTEGCFMNSCCVTYEIMDSVAASGNFFRFSDFIRGTKRAYTQYEFNGDQMVMKVYTTKFDTVFPLQLHSTYTATLGSRDNITAAVSRFGYPKKEMTRDFSNAFGGMNQSIFFTFENDPYSSVLQPYVGNITAHVSIDSNLTVAPADQVLLLFTTQPLFINNVYHSENLKCTSKYVYLSVNTTQYKIRDTHPGLYYMYAFVDRNHDGLYLTGDYMNSDFTHSFTVPEKGEVDVSTRVDFVIP